MTYFNTFIHINQMYFNALINIAVFTPIKTAMVLIVNKYFLCNPKNVKCSPNKSISILAMR